MGIHCSGIGLSTREAGERVDQYATDDDYTMHEYFGSVILIAVIFVGLRLTRIINSSRNDRTIQELLMQSDGWVKRLDTLEKEMMIPNDSSNDLAVNRMSIRVVDTADPARSTRDFILSLYGHRSYYHKILDPREETFALALELQADYSRVSRIIDNHLEDDLLPVEAASNAVDKGSGVHAYASTKSVNSSEELQFLIEFSRSYPCRAIAVFSTNHDLITLLCCPLRTTKFYRLQHSLEQCGK